MDEIKEITRKEFEEAVDALAKSGAMEKLIEIYKTTTDETARATVGEAIVAAANQIANSHERERIIQAFDAGLPKHIADRITLALCAGIEKAGEGGNSCSLDKLLGKKNLPSAARELVEPALVKALEVNATKDGHNIYFLLDLRERRDASERVRAAAASALITSIEEYGKSGARHGIIKILGSDGLPDEVTLKAIEVAAEKGWYDDINKLLEKRKLSEAVILSACKTLAECLDWDIKEFYTRAELSDRGRIEIVRMLGDAGEAEILVQLTEAEKPSSIVQWAQGFRIPREVVDDALFAALQNYGKRDTYGWPHRITKLIEVYNREGTSTRVRDAIEPALLSLLEKVDQNSRSASSIRAIATQLLTLDNVPAKLKEAMEKKVVEGLDGINPNLDDYHTKTQLEGILGIKDKLSPNVREAAERAYRRSTPPEEVIKRYLEEQGTKGLAKGSAAMHPPATPEPVQEPKKGFLARLRGK